nr:hypothetical protein StreXyl84_66290 [Streptomyces sp. Xyl84]
MSLGVAGSSGAAGSSTDRVKRGSTVFLERLPGRSEFDMGAGAEEQGDAEPGFDPADRLGQRLLGDREPDGGPAEVQLVGDREDGLEFASLRIDDASRVSLSVGLVLDTDVVRREHLPMNTDSRVDPLDPSTSVSHSDQYPVGIKRTGVSS